MARHLRKEGELRIMWIGLGTKSMRGVEWKCIDKIVKLEEESNHTIRDTSRINVRAMLARQQIIQTPHSVERFTYGRSITIGYCYAPQ